MKRRDVARILVLPALGLRPWDAFAQAYPERTVTMLYPYAAGGAATLFGQALAERSEQKQFVSKLRDQLSNI